MNLSLGPATWALLESSSPYLILPSDLARNLTLAIGARQGLYWFHNIPCERRQELPTLTFGLGGKEFSIGAFEYTLEVDGLFPHAGKMCVTNFMASEESFPNSWEEMVLGSPFLKGFWSVWDFGERDVGCESCRLRIVCRIGVACLLIGESSGVIKLERLEICSIEIWKTVSADYSIHQALFDKTKPVGISTFPSTPGP